MYENRKQPLISRKKFVQRMSNNLLVSMAILVVSLGIGVFGFHALNQSSWIDSLHNASMLLGGMGPVVEMKSDSAKLFSSIYALFCGVVFITNIGVLLAPLIHRIFHRLHMEGEK